ncbi:hypothetical protein FA95DRAFT_1606501 [Auriscalpium vulgare]|uniref:Uncharacterized protein n=1 Tax=Auriscalpium vulgare TaxID=40419 RepID=A0ACB8RSY0_9AGAM|nr:hypothetical protein FA95DRAFT_1606501 [Auriscalpium vulgare]
MPDSEPVTPFIPPFEMGGSASPIRPNVIPPNAVPTWSPSVSQAPPSAHPAYLSPYGTPYVHPASMQTPSSYFMPNVQLPQDAAGGAPPPLQHSHSQGPPPGAYPPPQHAPPHSAPPPGFSADWTGFQPQHGMPPPAAAGFTPYAPPGAPPPWQTPGYATGYSAYQTPLPPTFPPQHFGMPPGSATWAPPFQTPLQGFATPGTPYGPNPYGSPPWGHPGMAPPQQAPGRPRQPERRADRVDKLSPFAAGPHYGPVLTPMLVKTVRVSLQVNPLLMPPADEERAYLKWNMLFSTSHCQRSTDPSHRSWSVGRDEPATFPRVSTLTLISRTLPWLITVAPSNPTIGVTCGDIVEQLSEFMQRRMRKEDYEGAQSERRRLIRTAYHHNRSRSSGVPGGRLGDGLKRLDWLGTQTMWGGVQRNDAFVSDRHSVALPCTLELVCLERPLMYEDEVQEEPQRRRDSSRHRSRSRAGSRPSSSLDNSP